MVYNRRIMRYSRTSDSSGDVMRFVCEISILFTVFVKFVALKTNAVNIII